MKVYAKADSVDRNYLTAGKLYEVINEDGKLLYIVCDDGVKTICKWGGCAHLDGGLWERVEPTRIISRASNTPKTWGEMTDAEKGALLRANLRGDLQFSDYNSSKGHPGGWNDKSNWFFADDTYYRIKPEPKRDTVKLAVWRTEGHFYEDIGTIDLIDGDPDVDSVKMDSI